MSRKASRPQRESGGGVDTLALERRRGITIKAGVVGFPVGDTAVNVIDTPGHPDFISEVERVLAVLDGAVLVLSAVEGVQPQTRILMRALQRLRVPTLLFVNKIDRMGADPDAVLAAVRTRLTSAALAMGSVIDPGTRAAVFQAYDDRHDTAFGDRRGPTSTAYDYRQVTPLVVAKALQRAGTRVCEPVLRVLVEVPTSDALAVQQVVTRWGAQLTALTAVGDLTQLEVRLVAARLHDLQRQLPDLTGGEGSLEPRFDGYEPVRGAPRPAGATSRISSARRLGQFGSFQPAGPRESRACHRRPDRDGSACRVMTVDNGDVR